MKSDYIVGVILAVLVVFGVYYTFLGGFSAIEFNELPYSELSVVGIDYEGYYQSEEGLIDLKDRLSLSGVEGHKSIKIFNESDSFYGSGKYFVGVILDRVEMANVLESDNYSTVIVPEKDYLVSEFEYKNKLSILVASYRINSFLQEELDSRNATSKSTIQIHNFANNKIIYLYEIN